MLKTKNFKKVPSLYEFVDSLVESFYQDGDVSPYAYRNLDKSERLTTIGQAALSEYASVKELIGNMSISTGGDMDKDPITIALKSSGNAKYIDRIKATKGDVTKTTNYKDIQELIKFAKATNNAINSPNESQVKFSDNLYNIEKAYIHLISHKELFEKAIKSEEQDSAQTFKFISEFYCRVVGLLEITFDVLYSSSIKAEFDYTPKVPVVKYMHFEYTDTLDDELVLIQYFNVMATSGKLRDLLTKNAQETVQESINQLMYENVLDVAFALLNSSKWFDAIILFPMYFIRYVTYLCKYIYASYNAIDVNFKKSVAISKSKNVTKVEYDKFAAESNKRTVAVTQSSKKAEMDSADDMKNTRSQLSSVSSSNSGTSGVLI